MKIYLSIHNFFKSLLLLLICIGCESDADIPVTIEEEYSPDFYDYSTEETINNLGDFELKIAENQIIFSSKHGNLDSPLRYYNDLKDFNFNGLYKLTGPGGEKFYFRFGWTDFENNKTIFSNVRWLKKIPPMNESTYTVSTVNLDFIQEGNISVSTIGDSQTWWKESQHLRRRMDHYLEDLIFVGSNTDIYGYGHEGEGGNETKEVLERFQLIPEANYYTVLLGTNDYKRSNDGAFQNIYSLFQKLKDKFPNSKIIYISPLPSDEEVMNEFNESLKTKILERIVDNPNMIYLDVAQEIKNDPNWLNDYMAPDGLHLSSMGVDLLARKIAGTIEADLEISD